MLERDKAENFVPFPEVSTDEFTTMLIGFETSVAGELLCGFEIGSEKLFSSGAGMFVFSLTTSAIEYAGVFLK